VRTRFKAAVSKRKTEFPSGSNSVSTHQDPFAVAVGRVSQNEDHLVYALAILTVKPV
jgi:hypothetical protein